MESSDETRTSSSPTRSSSGGERGPRRGVGSAVSLGAVQPKSVFGEPGGRYEQEADAVADRITRGEHAPAISRLSPSDLRQPNGGPAQRQEDDRIEEEELVQRQVREDEDEPVQGKVEPEEAPTLVAGPRLPEEEEPVQKQALEDEEEERPQAKEHPGAVSPGGASSAMHRTGSGSPLPLGVRSTLEAGMGRDFSGVRVHDGPGAQRAAASLNAKAFTQGNDIYLGRGASPTDTHLMAHEAAHVVQQSAAPERISSVQRQEHEEEDELVQREPDDSGSNQRQSNGNGEGYGEADDTGELDERTSTITFEEISIPSFKARGHRASLYQQQELRRKAGYDRDKFENTNQRTKWIQETAKEGIVDELKEVVAQDTEGERGRPSSVNENETYVFDVFGQNQFMVGDLSTVASELIIPTWGKKEGGGLVFQNNFHVDHIVELQIANWDDNPWANSLENMELLEGDANMSSGATLRSRIDSKVDRFVEAREEDEFTKAAVKENYSLVFRTFTGEGGPEVGREDYWKNDEIEQGEHLQPEEAISLEDHEALGEEGNVLVFPSPTGGIAKGFSWDPDGPEEQGPTGNESTYLSPFELVAKSFAVGEAQRREEELGVLRFRVPENSDTYKPTSEAATLTVKRLPGARFAGYLEKNEAKATLRRVLEVEGLSLLQIDRIEFLAEQGFLITGQILPDVPLIGDANIRFEVRGDQLIVSKVFKAGDLVFPGPVEVTESSLRLSASSDSGLGLGGEVGFVVEGVGTGRLEGRDDSAGFHVAGSFDFDSELFTEATIDLGYHKPPEEDGTFTGEGTLSIGRDKVPGIQSASIDVVIEDDSWAADGTVTPEIPAIEQGELTAAYAPERGFAITGTLTLSSEVPALRGGTLSAAVAKRESGEGYKIRASGEADLDVPGTDAVIDVVYEDGTFMARGSIGYERGMLSGQLTAGVTNQPIGENGRPTGEETTSPSEDLRAFGGGQLTIQIAPWLEGTIGVELLHNGEVEVLGEVALPSTVELFPEERYEKRLLDIGLDVPIVGVAVAGQRIGIFATVSGGLEARAAIGPGELREARLSVQYNPDREQDTTVTGQALFVVPADAGIRLFVRGGVGAGIPVVSAEAGLEAGGELGLAGAAEAETDVNWTPQAGIVLHAQGEIYAEPSFVFDLSGYAAVTADLVLTTVELYDRRFELASYEWGSGMRVGILFPVDYREGEPFDLSLQDIEFVYPQIEPKALLTDLVDEVA